MAGAELHSLTGQHQHVTGVRTGRVHRQKLHGSAVLAGLFERSLTNGLLRLRGKHESRDHAMVALLKAGHTGLVMPAVCKMTSDAQQYLHQTHTSETQLGWLQAFF